MSRLASSRGAYGFSGGDIISSYPSASRIYLNLLVASATAWFQIHSRCVSHELGATLLSMMSPPILQGPWSGRPRRTPISDSSANSGARVRFKLNFRGAIRIYIKRTAAGNSSVTFLHSPSNIQSHPSQHEPNQRPHSSLLAAARSVYASPVCYGERCARRRQEGAIGHFTWLPLPHFLVQRRRCSRCVQFLLCRPKRLAQCSQACGLANSFLPLKNTDPTKQKTILSDSGQRQPSL